MKASDQKAYDAINARILDAMSNGVVPWRKPWSGASMAPRNFDGRRYSGINAFFLSLLGYEDPRFITFNRCKELGGSIIEGSKGKPVVYWNFLLVDEKDKNGEKTGNKRKVPFLKMSYVFNAVEETKGLDIKPLVIVNNDIKPIDAAEAIVQGMPNRPTIFENGGDRAYYSPSSDDIHMPKRASFHSDEGWYETLFHELSHSTGAKSRLDRHSIIGFDHFGGDKYAREELVAEFGASYLMGEAGLANDSTIENVAAYLDSWRQRIVSEPDILVWAASKASAAARYILGEAAQQEQGQEQAA